MPDISGSSRTVTVLHTSTERQLGIRKDLYAMVALPGGVTMFQGIGEFMAKECNVSFDRVLFQ